MPDTLTFQVVVPYLVALLAILSLAALAGFQGYALGRRRPSGLVETVSRLKESRNIAMAESRAKSEFLASMTHEIRTPLAAIIGFSELLLEPNQPLEERVNFVRIIRRNGELLSHIVGNVLDLSKIEAGRMEIERIPVNIRHLVRDAVESLKQKAECKGLKLDCDLREIPADVELRTDPTRLVQILVNVVGNAIKFTEHGVVCVSARLLPANDTALPRLELVVRDTGIGFTHEQRAKTFQCYSQADASTSRKYGGTGLGLHLSRHLAHLLGGELSLVETAPGLGSVFKLTMAADIIKPAAQVVRAWPRPVKYP